MKKKAGTRRSKQTVISITEVTFESGPKKKINVQVDGERVGIPVASEVYAYWHDQFVRENPSQLQKKRFATLMSVVRAAFLEGVRVGRA